MAKDNEKTNELVVGVDLGGTKILAAVITADGKILGQAKRKTKPEAGTESVIDRIVKTVDDALGSAKITRADVRAVGIGAPGPIDPDTGTVLMAPNLNGWENVALAKMLRDQLDLPIFLDNDVNVGTLGEYVYGAGRGASDVIGVFVGTGVGGGLIIGGQLRSGARHAAGEIGHMIVLADGPFCGCGNRGCIEALASRTAIVQSLRMAVLSGRKTVLADALAGGGVERLSSGALAQAWKANDTLTVEVLSRVQHYLGLHIASLVNFMDPELIVLGGGVIEAMGEDFLPPIRRVAYQHFTQRRDANRVKIVMSQLGDNAGILGAAVTARFHLNS
ncbi:MAG: ROK family protein [Anaerolineae bacterium]